MQVRSPVDGGPVVHTASPPLRGAANRGLPYRSHPPFCRWRLAGHEIPKTYHLVDAHPVGKILEHELTARIDGGEPGQVDNA